MAANDYYKGQQQQQYYPPQGQWTPAGRLLSPATTKLVPAGRVSAAVPAGTAAGIPSAGIPAEPWTPNHLRPAPQQSSSGGGCMACLAGVCLCCCAEELCECLF
ncbi:hypothetical protein DFH07DRAFT_581624 [Mycena maculata]|uniref:Cysteine-rich transmembrane CYSTM domain-containing protein n=1 Tax=Mycena maculata TaxID=230809 RepID=A0AAD7IN22_9AGAR|nr:hypothetical protein DFH07DRAFT_581624 [Mycena maculata]